MKQLIVPIAILVALIAFFAIIDRKEFSRHDDVQTVQGESLSSDRKPTVSVPEPKTVTETKSAVAPQPVTETKPKTDAKSAETKPIAETKPEAETKSEAQPSAVPVATAEEAIRANEDALKLLPKKETTTLSKDIKSDTKTIAGNKSVPMAVPVLTPEEAIKANKEAIGFQRNKAIANAFQSFIHRIGLNRIHFILSLLPLLLIIDVIFFKRKKKCSSKLKDYFSLPRRICILFSVSLLAFGILVFVPWSVYFGNSLQFPFIFQDFVNWNLRVLTISIIGACIILLLIPPIVSDYLVAIIAGLGLCVYVQAMFMNQHLGTMDGLEPVWSEHRVFGTINLIIWIAIVLSPVVLRKLVPSYFSKVISMATGIVLFLELLATASMVVSASSSVWTRQDSYYVDSSQQFQLSKEKNIILFVMDMLGSENVKECFRSSPETKEIVKDFIWYADACSYYRATYLGLPHELTGTSFPPPANSCYESFQKMWHSTPSTAFYKQIHDAGYEARFYVKQPDFTIGSADCYHEYFSNIVAKDIIYEIDYNCLHDCLKQISLFSSVPYLIKKNFYYSFDFSDNVVQKLVPDIPSGKQALPYLNDDFLRRMLSSGISTNADSPILAYYYIRGAHVPWIYDEKSNRTEELDSPIPTVKGCFYLLSELIRLLKEAGIYDNTAILLCSDHGGHKGFSNPYDMTFMVKPFQENKTEVSIIDSKVQSIDILPTILKLACGDTADFKDFEGFPSFDIPNDRKRKIYVLTSCKDYPVFEDEQGVRSNCVEEYIFNDIKTLKLGKESESFVRRIPFTIISQEIK